MPRATTTPEQKAEALRLYVEHGPAEASRRTGIARGTISAWAIREGVAPDATISDGGPTVAQKRRARVAAATEAAKASAEERRARLADKLLESAERVADQIFAPLSSPKVTVKGVVMVETPEPEPRDKRDLASTASTLIKDHLLLSGEATERTEVTDGGAARKRVEELQAQWRRRLEERRARNAG